MLGLDIQLHAVCAEHTSVSHSVSQYSATVVAVDACTIPQQATMTTANMRTIDSFLIVSSFD